MKVCPVGLHPAEVGSTRLRARILQALPVWWGYKYGHKVDYPPHIPGIPSTLIRTGTREIDCSTFTYGLLATVYPKADWGFERYKKWQMWGRDDLYGPLTTADELGITTQGRGNGWYLYQKWEKPWEGGHSFLALKRGDLLLVLEATTLSSMSGVIWRNICKVGEVDSFDILPSEWSGTEEQILDGAEFRCVRLRG